MKAMLLAAGLGTRLRPLTERVPKALVDIGGESLLSRHLRALESAGFTEVVINLAHLGQVIRNYLSKSISCRLKLAYSDEGPLPLGTAAGITNALRLLGDAPFAVINADIWTDYPFQNLHKTIAGDAHLVLVNNPAEHPQGDFHLHGQQVHPTQGPRYTFAGIGIYKPRLFTGRDPRPAALAPLLREAIDHDIVSGEHYTGRWYDIGTPQRLAQVRKLVRCESG